MKGPGQVGGEDDDDCERQIKEHSSFLVSARASLKHWDRNVSKTFSRRDVNYEDIGKNSFTSPS